MAVKDQEKSKTKTVRVAKAFSQRKSNATKTKVGSALTKAKPARLAELRRGLRLTQPEFSRLASISVRSLAALEAGAAPTEAIVRKFVELERLEKSLAEVMRRETIGTWLKTPNPAFEGLKPLEVIERGEIDRLWSMIFFLRSGAPS